MYLIYQFNEVMQFEPNRLFLGKRTVKIGRVPNVFSPFPNNKVFLSRQWHCLLVFLYNLQVYGKSTKRTWNCGSRCLPPYVPALFRTSWRPFFSRLLIIYNGYSRLNSTMTVLYFSSPNLLQNSVRNREISSKIM